MEEVFFSKLLRVCQKKMMPNFTFTTDSFFEILPSLLLQEGRPLRVLMVGDVMGRPGRRILKLVLKKFRALLPLDLVVVNAENIAGGFGVTEKVFKEMLTAGVDVMTLGNHWADKPDVHRIRDADPRLVFPQNLRDLAGVETIPEFEIPGRDLRVCLINLLGQFAMKDSYGNPFDILAKEKAQLAEKVRSGTHIVLADIHAEASSEKQAAGWFLDGVAACIIGTHTHTPTSDERIFPLGTAFLSDVGMTGPYHSIIGIGTLAFYI